MQSTHPSNGSKKIGKYSASIITNIKDYHTYFKERGYGPYRIVERFHIRAALEARDNISNLFDIAHSMQSQ